MQRLTKMLGSCYAFSKKASGILKMEWQVFYPKIWFVVIFFLLMQVSSMTMRTSHHQLRSVPVLQVMEHISSE